MIRTKVKINMKSQKGIEDIAKYCADNFIEPRMFDNLDINKIYKIDEITSRWSDSPIRPENIKPGMIVGLECDTVEMHSYKGKRFGKENGPTELYVVGVDFDSTSGNLSIMSDGKFISTVDISEQIRTAEQNEMHLVASDEFQRNFHELIEQMMESKEVERSLHNFTSTSIEDMDVDELLYEQGMSYESESFDDNIIGDESEHDFLVDTHEMDYHSWRE